ncbi:MAG: glycosyltransferase [Eubacteriales bacterium]|nr:glycosyltransferase [Eubacteriales bacterium]
MALTEKKKLLLVVPMLHQGGFERVCVRTARILEQDFEVTIALFSDADIAYDIEGLRTVNLDVPSAEGKARKAANVARRIVRLRRLKKKLRPDITYSFGPTANLVNVLTPMCGQIWTGIRSYMDLDNPGKLRLFLWRSDRVVCCSARIADELTERFGARNTEVLYNPYDSRSIAESAQKRPPDMPDFSGKKLMVSMGREDDCKEFWHLIKALYLIREDVPQAALCIVGDGDFAEYRRLSEQLGLSGRVFFAGMQKNPFPWLAAGTLYVGASSMEGFPNALVEAMSCGLPALFSNCPSGPAEILSDRYRQVKDRQEVLEEAYGILMPVMDDTKNLDPSVFTDEERRLAGLLAGLLKDEKRLDRLSQRAAVRAAQFSDSAYRENILRIASER